ncbi:pyrin domain-containing protein 1 [Sander lucioperca]|uniref:pyrin domain-containing protein 1 n=1 Tax=Sander lucioperca TaxID=283035 RepID=UPI001653BB15|nr:pyrin domain-containing protein 1 [Sander lucioperca]
MEIMSDKEVLLKTLEDLEDEEFKKFKWFLQDPDILVGFQAFPKNKLEKADMLDTVDKIIQTFSHQSVEVVKKVLKKINRNDLVEKLSSTSPGAQGVSPSKPTALLLNPTVDKAQ